MRITNDDRKPSLDPESLEHYGIKGMKWGVRRTDAQLARARGKRKGSVKKKVKKAYNKLDEALTGYEAHKRKLKGEAFLTDLFGLDSSARRQLNALDSLENDVIKLGGAAAKQINKEIQVALLKREMKNL